MELLKEVSQGQTNTKMKEIDGIVSNIIKDLKEKKFTEQVIFSYLFHKIAYLSLWDIFDSFPDVDQEIPRRETLKAHFVTMRDIYNKKYKQIEESRKR